MFLILGKPIIHDGRSFSHTVPVALKSDQVTSAKIKHGMVVNTDIKSAISDIDPPSQELLVTAQKMMVAALNDSDFNWNEAERLAALPDFGVLEEMKKLRLEVENA